VDAAAGSGAVYPQCPPSFWLDLIETVAVPKLAIAGVQWATVPGSLAAHEEHAEVVLESLGPSLHAYLQK